MELSEILVSIKLYKKIVVTGPQRSGTTIAAKIIAAELNYQLIMEETFREDNLIDFTASIIENEFCVIQAPALASIIHLLKKPEIAVVFMMRPVEDIIASESRINWLDKHDSVEKNKYFRFDSPEPISLLKQSVWKTYQKNMLKERAFELEYNSLQTHSLWVPGELRKSFHSRQTEIE